jgi:hypothetical protein
VRDIHAILYTNKSVLSTTSSIVNNSLPSKNYLTGSASADTLRHQLYIRGAAFSENTIGGSRSSPIQCPYYVTSATCDQNEAQSYDLNYLRRYYMFDNTDNAIDDPTPSWIQSRANGQTWTYEEFPVIIDYNPAIQQTPPPFFD